jgi:hypothetical protein
MIKLFDLAKETKAYGKFEMGRVYSNPYHTAFTPQVNEAEESEDHEVSMANNSIDTIIKMATELKAKMGENEKNIPAWIQDHISKAENYISQAASNYHEYGNENVNEGSLYSSQKLTIPQLGQLKIGDKVKYLGKDINGFMSGEEYEVSRRESSSTFQPTITIKNNRGKKLRTTNLSKINESVNEAGPCWKGYKQVGMKNKNGKEVPNCVPINEGLLKEVRSVKVVQKDIDKVLTNIQTALSQYKAHKGSADEKKHIDNLKKLTKLRKDLEDEMEVSVSQLYKDAEFDV